MGVFDPIPTPYDPLEWAKRPFPERARMVCQAWAMQGYGTPLGVYAVYVLKMGLFVLGWALFCGTSPALGGIQNLSQWWLHPIAFQKAIVWSLLFEGLGLGCGSGPLTGRYFPPVGGFLYFLRPGTTKLPLRPGLPLVGGATRTILDVALYAAIVAASVRALAAPAPSFEHFLPLAILVPLAGLSDKTVFLALRAEHFWVTIVIFAFARDWIAGAKLVQLALWFWAGVSKLNHHFPTVTCVMTSNSPLTRWAALRRAMYRSYPDDLRPSRVATALAHGGTALEVAVPLAFALTPLGVEPVVAVLLMFGLHGYITSNVPMGVPLEWNVAVVYGGLALFWAHPEVSVFAMGPAWLWAFVLTFTLALPLFGNLFPGRISFLLAMRYYAGNWAYSVWLFKKGSEAKLKRLTASSGWVYEQLDRFYPRATSVGLVGKVMAFRMMHLHGRALPLLLPRTIASLDDYEWMDGEIVAGVALGWNFGEGHLHHEALCDAIQAQCEFLPGELRCIFVESQPLFGDALAYRLHDAASGPIEAGALPVAELRSRQPWEGTGT